MSVINLLPDQYPRSRLTLSASGPKLTIGDRPAMSACQGEAVVTSALAEVRK